MAGIYLPIYGYFVHIYIHTHVYLMYIYKSSNEALTTMGYSYLGT